ncbi:hypothetical protein D3C76_461180 [compost metagenome]
MHEIQIGWFQRSSALRHHRKFGQRSITAIENTGEDGIARFETGHLTAHLGHDTGQIAAQCGGKLKMKHRFEHAGRNHVVDRVQAGGINLNQHFVRLQCGARDIREPNLRRLAVAFECECFHGSVIHPWLCIGVRSASSARNASTSGTKAR